MGASCDGQSGLLGLSDELSCELGAVRLRWVRGGGAEDKTRVEKLVHLPVYLHASRQQLLFALDLPAQPDAKPERFAERGVAVVCSSQIV